LTEAGVVPVLVDSLGNFVAYHVDSAIAQYGPDFVQINWSPTGFFPAPSSEFMFYHVDSGCAGPRLMLSSDDFTTPMFVTTGNVGYYGGTPPTPQTVASEETFLDGEDVSQPSAHCGAPTNLPVPAYFGPVKTIDLNSLGLVPPFIEQLQ
jgi:hypothetical protein